MTSISDFSRYRPPGVYTEPVPGPQIGINSTAPTGVALLGIARGYRTLVESLVINADEEAVTTTQLITLTGTPTGNWGVNFAGQPTANIPVDASEATVEAALIALANVPVGGVTVEGDDGGPWLVTFTGELEGESQPLFTKIITGLTGGDVVISKTDLGVPAVNRTLSQKGIITDSIEVRNPITGAVYALGTDYTVFRVNAGPDAVTNTRDDLYTIKRVIDGGHIDVTDTIQISYRYTDPDYFSPQLFYDYDDVRDAYGEPFDAAGNIVSELTLGAKFAFLNGAFIIVTVAVDPANPSSPTVGDYNTALQKLTDHPYVAVIVPCTGAQPLFQLVQEHVKAQSENRFERRAILGRDGSVTSVASSQRIIDAQTLTDERIAMVCPTAFTYFSAELNREISLGGQFMAAALAGITVKYNPAMPLTRKVIDGWTGVVEQEQEGQKNLETQNGLLVVEKTRRQLMQVRHGVTTNPTSLLTREWSIRGQADSMVYRLRDYLEADDLIGQPILPITMINTKASAEAALQSLIRDSIIRDYLGLKVRQLKKNPDVLEVSYSWLPAFPLNYILVRYAVTLSTGDVTSTGGSRSTSDVSALTLDDGNTLSSI